jgi:hypothetical protein
MLNLFKLNSNITKKNIISKKRKSSKHFPSSIREWKNSIYVFNKNALNLIPSSTLVAINLIKSYFNLFNKEIEKKMRTKRLLLRLRRLSSNKIYISNGEFKHTNNKVIITLYVFNRQKNNYLLTLKNWYLKSFFKDDSLNFNDNLISILKLINSKGLLAIRKAYEDKYYLIKALNSIDNNNKYINIYDYITKFYIKLIKKTLRKVQLYFYYKQLLYINKSKLNYTYLQYLNKYLERIYNKNIEFNIVNLKRFFLNSDILSESITLKLTKNRRKMLKYLNTIKNKVKISRKKIFLGKPFILRPSNIKDNYNNNDILKVNTLDNLKYRHVTGFRLEAKGRLTRRYTASRSVYKIRYKGNLLDIDSSYRGLSSVLLKGNLKSNIQFTKLNSKSRIGSFGIKGWISGN